MSTTDRSVTKIPRASESLARMTKAIEDAASARDRIMLEVYRDHWWGEVTGDVDAIMATMPTDRVSYHFDGSTFLMPKRTSFYEVAAARKMYQSIADIDLPIAGPFEDERFAFADWGLTCEAIQTGIYPGRLFPGHHEALDPKQLYLAQWHSFSLHPIDSKRRLMLGETVYAGSAIRVEPVDRSAIAVMLS
jgi:hypothetical protein